MKDKEARIPGLADRSDEELMVLVQRGDRQAYQELFARHRDPIWSYLLRRTGDSEGSSELFQDVFMRVWRSAHTYQSNQPFRPWLYRVASNVARDTYRHQSRQVDTTSEEFEFPDNRINDPLSTRDLESAIQALPDTLRSAFILGAVHGMDHREVASALGISAENARARISRARVRLRNQLVERET